MRVAIISDTHLPRGSRALPAACVERLRGADVILHGGDFTSEDALEELRAFGPPVHAVFGNMDRGALARDLPREMTVELEGARIGMVHIPGPASGRFERLRKAFPDADAVVFGHTHMPEHEEREGFQIFNPGSPTERRRAPAKTMGMATITDGRVEFELVVVG